MALLGGRGHRLRVLTPAGRRRWIQAEDLRELLCEPLTSRRHHGTEGQPSSQVDAALVEHLLARRPVSCGWIVRPSPGASLGDQLLGAGLVARLITLTAARVLQLLLWIASWWVIGRAALSGRFDPGWLTAWALLLLTLVPLRAWITEAQGRLTLSAGAILMRRLLAGALNLGPDTTRHQGIGQLLGRVLESEALSSLALAGGFSSFFSILELAAAGWVLWYGASGLPLLLLVGAVGLSVSQGWILHRKGRLWTDRRLSLTHDLVEELLGHQTRLAQAQPGTVHLDEDEGLSRYLSLSRGLDEQALRLALIPRVWLLLGMAGLAPAFVHGSGSQEGLAIGLGGILLAHQGFRSLSCGLAQVVAAAIAWDRVSELYRAAAKPRQRLPQTPPPPSSSAGAEGQGPVLEARDLTFCYPNRTRPVLKSLDLAIDPRDRILLEGPSGGGKSTLVSLLNGLRSPSSGLLLLSGLDLASVGSTTWRRRIAAAPQLHENHVFNDSFAFNVLLGRRWPPRREDMEEAEEVCRELGLGELLDEMPGGLGQVVGETGWRLSHGERSRLFIARALLQGADLVIADESLGALDPETLQQTLRCLEKRSPALLLIAHP